MGKKKRKAYEENVCKQIPCKHKAQHPKLASHNEWFDIEYTQKAFNRPIILQKRH